MNELCFPDVATVTVATAATAALGFSSAVPASLDRFWAPEERSYFIDQAAPTLWQMANISFPSVEQSFVADVAAVFAELAAGQEPLGADFEAVWNDNLEALYEF